MSNLDYALTLRAAVEDALEAFGLVPVSSTKDEKPGFIALGSLFESADGKQIVVTVSCEDSDA